MRPKHITLNLFIVHPHHRAIVNTRCDRDALSRLLILQALCRRRLQSRIRPSHDVKRGPHALAHISAVLLRELVQLRASGVNELLKLLDEGQKLRRESFRLLLLVEPPLGSLVVGACTAETLLCECAELHAKALESRRQVVVRGDLLRHLLGLHLARGLLGVSQKLLNFANEVLGGFNFGWICKLSLNGFE
ncbi:hypothetical protein FCOIX_12968 [Fusarium coicis]|nr:hypothetical protein FCOIX_12968 [Fusarium coicis]